MRQYKVIGYVGTKDMPLLKEEDMKALDIVNLAFACICDGEVRWNPQDSLPIIKKAKSFNPDIKFIVSVGGWSAGGFSKAAASEEGRKKFAKTAVDLLEHYDLDGIDIDWEYPCFSVAGIDASADDKVNFTLLLKTIREELNEVNEDYYLTIAAGGDDYYIRSTQMELIHPYLNYVQIMTYDLRGGFVMTSGHHTNLYTPSADLYNLSVDKAVKDYVKAGVPKEKLVIGAAFYARRWDGVANRNNGYMQPAKTVGMGSYAYHEILELCLDKNGFIRYWDEEAKAPYLYNGDTFISYDDKESLAYKAEYVKEQGLLGMMYWEYGCDKTYTLTHCIREYLGNFP
jgi:chitinase